MFGLKKLFAIAALTILGASSCSKQDWIGERPEDRKPNPVEKKIGYQENTFMTSGNLVVGINFKTSDQSNPEFRNDANGDLTLTTPGMTSFFADSDSIPKNQLVNPFGTTGFKNRQENVYLFKKTARKATDPDTLIRLIPQPNATQPNGSITLINKPNATFYQANNFLEQARLAKWTVQ